MNYSYILKIVINIRLGGLKQALGPERPGDNHIIAGGCKETSIIEVLKYHRFFKQTI